MYPSTFSFIISTKLTFSPAELASREQVTPFSSKMQSNSVCNVIKCPQMQFAIIIMVINPLQLVTSYLINKNVVKGSICGIKIW